MFELPLIGILRGFSAALLPKIFAAVSAGGLQNIEITMNSPAASDQIRQAREIGGMTVGAGTVTDTRLLNEALAAGAKFIVTPSFNREVVLECVQAGVPVFPGAFSPTEICEAWDTGATMVKIFSADTFGPGYLRALRGPFPGIKLLPTGGVDLESGHAFLQAGAAGLGVGSPLFDKQRIETGDWAWLQSQTEAFVRLFRSPLV